MKSENKSNINGLFIYRDNRDNVIYHDIFTNKDYLIPADSYNRYSFYSMRAVVSIVVIFILKDVLNFDFSYAAFIGVCIYLILSVLFRFNFLYAHKESYFFYNHDRDNIVFKTAKEYSAGQLCLLILIMAIITAWLIYQSYKSGYAGTDLIAAYALSSIAVLVIIFYLIVLSVKLIRKY